MLGDVLAKGATLFGSILNNLRRVVIRLKVDISSCGMKHGNYLAAIIVILVMLLGLGCRQGKQAKNSHSSGGNALGSGDIGDAGISGLVVTKAVDVLPVKVSQGLVRLISRLISIPSSFAERSKYLFSFGTPSKDPAYSSMTLTCGLSRSNPLHIFRISHQFGI